MACSGHERTASAALASRSAGRSPSMTAVEWPSTSSSWNTSGAIMAQSVCPWQRSGSTCTFTFSPFTFSEKSLVPERTLPTPRPFCRPSQVEVVPLEVAAGIHAHLHAGNVAGLVGRQEQHHVADVHRLDVGDRHGLHLSLIH